MNNIQYFKSAWGDIKNSPGWFGKLCILALISFIPIFGSIVVMGYLYGWAREIAWGTHEPMPERIFANEDGKLYRRGWFIFVLALVASIISSIIMNIGSGMQGSGFMGLSSGSHAVANSVVGGIGSLVYVIGILAAIVLSVAVWVGSMRISIYDRLSAGFQVDKIWKMIRQDPKGLLRIFGMDLLFQFVIGIVLSIVFSVLLMMVVFVGVAGLASSGYSMNELSNLTEYQALLLVGRVFLSAGAVGIVGLVVSMFVAFLGSTFVEMLVARAMGYWTLQFDVPRWRGQDDPMPFENAPAVGVGAAGAAGVAGVAGAAQQWQASSTANMQPNAYDQTAYGQNSYGQAANAQTAYGQAANAQASYGQAANAQASYGQTEYQQPAYGQPENTQPAHNQQTYQQPAYGQPANNQQQPAYGQQAYQQSGYNQPTYGQQQAHQQQQPVYQPQGTAPILEPSVPATFDESAATATVGEPASAAQIVEEQLAEAVEDQPAEAIAEQAIEAIAGQPMAESAFGASPVEPVQEPMAEPAFAENENHLESVQEPAPEAVIEPLATEAEAPSEQSVFEAAVDMVKESFDDVASEGFESEGSEANQ